MIIRNKQRPMSQHGFATVLIVLLVGLAVAVSALGTAYYINISQRTLVSSHALTNAQSGAWSGVEIFRKYLKTLSQDDFSNLEKSPQTFTLNIPEGRTLNVNNVKVKAQGTTPEIYQVTANIQNISDKSESSSTIQVVYEILFSEGSGSDHQSSGNTTKLPSAMNFYGDLNANGGITFSNVGDRAIVNVSGNFSTSSGLTGIKELKVLGDVNIGGGGITGLENIYSNGNVNLNASGTASLVSAKGSVTTTGGVAVKDIYADGDVNIKSSGNFNSIDTKGSITVDTNPTITKATAGNKITVNNGTILNSLANSDIKYNVWNQLNTAKSGGVFTCVSPYWNNFTNIAAVNFMSCPTNAADKLTQVATGTKVAFPTGALVTVTMDEKPLINASAYEEQANYVFSVNSQNQILVYVRNVNGVAEGSYHLGKTKINYSQSWGYLCKEVDSDNFCTSSIVANFAKKYGWVNEIISYSNGIWTLRDTQNSESSIASGVIFFKGTSVNLEMGNYANTIISTGNINYGGSISMKAPNYAGASVVCGSSYFPMPTNLCASKDTLSLASIANIALIAGSCTDTSSTAQCSATYIGGDITLTSQATIEGNVIAGNRLITGGQTIVKGSILAAALGKNTGSTLGGSTTIDFNGTTSDQNTITVPNTGNNDSESSDETETVSVKWARYI